MVILSCGESEKTITHTVCPKTATSTRTTTATTTTPTSDPDCLTIFNNFRRKQGLPQFKYANSKEIQCAHKAAKYDAKNGYHASFSIRMCKNHAQCECKNGVNGGGLKNCINAYISEGPPGTTGKYPQENHGHWNIITGPYKAVACGSDGKGFYTHNFYL